MKHKKTIEKQPLATAFNSFVKEHDQDFPAYRAFGEKLYCQGDFTAAIWYFKRGLEAAEELKQDATNDYNLIAVSYYALKQYNQALHWLEKLLTMVPQNHKVLANAAMMANRLDQLEKAEDYFLQCLAINPNFTPALDGITHLYGKQGKMDQVQHYGQTSLNIKNQEALAPENIAHLEKITQQATMVDTPIKPFNPSQPSKNIISFSLFGEQPHYQQAAILNATLIPVIYPGWQARFYCEESLPADLFQQLKQLKAQIVTMKKSNYAYEGLFWRFMVADDSQVDRYLIRDIDSVVNCQERVAVDEWLQSNKYFHVMRDYYTHSELLLGGLWGGIPGALPNMTHLIRYYLKQVKQERTIDQQFLRNYLWPYVSQSYLGHDSVYHFDHAKDFPPLGQFPGPQWHVGQNWFWQQSS